MWASETVGLRSVHAGQGIQVDRSAEPTYIRRSSREHGYLLILVVFIHFFSFLHQIIYHFLAQTQTPLTVYVVGVCVLVYTSFSFGFGCIGATCLWDFVWDLPVCRVIVSVLVENTNPTSTETIFFPFIKFLLCVFWSASFDPYDFNGEWMLNRLAKSKKWQFFWDKCFTLKMFSMWYDFEREKWFSCFFFCVTIDFYAQNNDAESCSSSYEWRLCVFFLTLLWMPLLYSVR